MKITTSCGVTALVLALTGSAFAQDSHRLNPPAAQREDVERAAFAQPVVATSGAGLVAIATPRERAVATGRPSPLGYLAIGGGAAVLGCVWLSRRYRIDV